MVYLMKTTILLPDDLYGSLKRRAAEKHVTVSSLIETAIRRTLEEEISPRPPFRLRKCAVSGSGLSPEFAGAEWGTLRGAIYEGRGE